MKKKITLVAISLVAIRPSFILIHESSLTRLVSTAYVRFHFDDTPKH